MYTSHIGKRFLEINNRNHKKKVSAKEYFENNFFKLFYDHPKYLHSPGNTPLFQLIAQKKTHDSQKRKEGLAEIHSKIQEFVSTDSAQPDMSFAIGYASADLQGTTSGQVTSMILPFAEEDMYSSWIGAGFGIGMEGGLSILFDHEELLGFIQEGWQIYRNHVEQNTGIDNKIDTWNGIWLTHRLSDMYNPKIPEANFKPVVIGKEGNPALERPPWTSLLFALAMRYPKSLLHGYVYSFGQMNKTVGIIQLLLPEVQRLSDFYDSMFGKSELMQKKKLAEIYETEYGFMYACQQGRIGLHSLQPKGLRKYMPGKADHIEFFKYKNDEQSQLTYSIYISWILAMLNNKDLITLSETATAMLHSYVARDRQARKVRSNKVDTLLNSRNRKELIESLTKIIEDDSTTSDLCNSIVTEVMINIPPDNIPLFVTLLKFKYALPTSSNN